VVQDWMDRLTRKRTPLGPYRRPVPRVLGESYGGGRFLMGEVPLHTTVVHQTHVPPGPCTTFSAETSDTSRLKV